MVTPCIATICIHIFVVINTVIVNVHIKAVCDTVIIVVVNIGVWVAIIDFFPIIYAIAIIVIVFVVVNSVIVVVKWVIISSVGDSIVIIISV